MQKQSFVLYQEKTDTVNAQISLSASDTQITVYNNEFGSSVKDFFGDSGVEYWVIVQRKDADNLRKKLNESGTIIADYEALIQWLVSELTDQVTTQKFESLLKAHDIPHKTEMWRSE